MWIALTLIAGLAGWTVFAYNRLVRDRTRVATAWSDIDVQLKRRHDLIPKLVEAVKQYAAYESATLAAIVAGRTGVGAARPEDGAGVEQVARGEHDLSAGLRKLLAVAEDYPDLKANQSFLDLQRNLTDVEQHLQYARRFYNGAVRNLNIRVSSFPDLLVARAFGFQSATFFELED